MLCGNNAICREIGNDYTCDCRRGFTSPSGNPRANQDCRGVGREGWGRGWVGGTRWVGEGGKGITASDCTSPNADCRGMAMEGLESGLGGASGA